MPIFCQITWEWTQKANLPAADRTFVVAFSIGNKGYVGTGADQNSNFFDDFWSYDPATDIWTQKADFAGDARTAAAGFSINGKGYIGTGRGSCSPPPCTIFNDLWEYDTAANNWSQKTGPGGPPRGFALGFSVNDKGYITGGNDGSGIGGTLTDLWEYDPVSDSWLQKTNFPGPPRIENRYSFFVIGNSAYLGTGDDDQGITCYNDWWEYNTVTDSWSQKADVPVSIPSRGLMNSVGFSICNKGFLGTGHTWCFTMQPLDDFWMFDPVANSWSSVTSFPGGYRYYSVSFVINNRAYVGMGNDPANTIVNELWEFRKKITASVFVSDTVICLGDTSTLIAFPSGLTYLWNTGDTTQTIKVNPFINDTFTVIVSDCNAADTSEVTIKVIYLPVATIASDTTVCSNTPATLTALPAGQTYFWSTGETTSSIIVSPLNDTMIWVLVTNSCGSGSDSAFIYVNPVPEAMILASDSLLCPGENTLLSVTPGGMNYLWNTGESSQIITVTPDTITAFSVAVTNSFGCNDTDSVTVSVKSPSMNISTQNVSFCDGKDGLISVIASNGYTPYSFVWSNGVSGADSLQFVIDSLQKGNYSLTVTDAQGCASVYAMSINDPPPPVVTITKNDISCNGKNDGSASLAASGGAPPYTYLWNTGNSSLTISGLSPGNYSVIVSDSLNCTVVQTETLTEPPPVIGSISGTNEICHGTSATLTASGGDSYQWNTGEVSESVIVSPDSTAIYSVVVSVGPCNDTVIYPVTVHKVEVLAESDTGIYTGGAALLTSIIIMGTPPYNFSWYPGNIPGENITVAPASTTSYIVNVIDANGCTDADTVTVRIILCGEDVFIPNAFSPECKCADSKLKVYSDCIAEMEIMIFDRWGEKVFETSNKESGWNGQYRGREMNSAVFVYYLKYTTIDQPEVKKIKKGNVQLLR